jgi:hypothetical protein
VQRIEGGLQALLQVLLLRLSLYSSLTDKLLLIESALSWVTSSAKPSAFALSEEFLAARSSVWDFNEVLSVAA